MKKRNFRFLMKLLIIQPYLAKYRVDLFNEVSKNYDEINIISSIDKNYKYGLYLKTKFKNILLKRINFFYFYLQIGIEINIIKLKPDKIFIAGDFRNLNFWSVLILSKLKSIPLYVHGQGLYKKYKRTYLHKFLFLFMLIFCKKYICYNEFVKKDLLRFNIKSKKLVFLNNSIINPYKSPPYKDKNKKDVVFIGRLRRGSNVTLLFQALKNLKEKHNISLKLKIIGDGEEKANLMKIVKLNKLDVKFYGEIYDLKKITKICKKSQFGIYPGDAGLSIVHFMSLSIVPIIHKNFTRHSGPEPSYVNKKNGLFFKRQSLSSLTNLLIKISKMSPRNIYDLSKNSYQTYLRLNKVKMSDNLIKILK